ncbi:uncharacterized protein LOC141729244 [Zonotrichia albicollis]|uniref:uncharacterized protein LOC141729244 n=1 Tax=Zonotrichia albicollis TaxID=44394 RepID=UPI003D80C2A0
MLYTVSSSKPASTGSELLDILLPKSKNPEKLGSSERGRGALAGRSGLPLGLCPRGGARAPRLARWGRGASGEPRQARAFLRAQWSPLSLPRGGLGQSRDFLCARWSPALPAAWGQSRGSLCARWSPALPAERRPGGRAGALCAFSGAPLSPLMRGPGAALEERTRTIRERLMARPLGFRGFLARRFRGCPAPLPAASQPSNPGT